MGIDEIIKNLTLREKAELLTGKDFWQTLDIERLGIPSIFLSDGPHGLRRQAAKADHLGLNPSIPATCFPTAAAMANSWNEELGEKMGKALGEEAASLEVNVLLGPGTCMKRNPRCGRNFEYFSEDPYLAGKMSAAYIRGIQANGTSACVKHFAANNQEFNRKKYNAVVSERALREIYLKGFEIAVKEGGAFAVMTTYGGINGLWTAGNYDLLTTILRNEWQFDGIAMTDWWADINEEGGEPSIKNTAAMVRSQNDIYMVAQDAEHNSNGDDLEESLENGTLKRADLAGCAGNILRVLMRLPVMDRSLGRQSREEIEAAEALAKEDQADPDIEWYTLNGKLELDG